MPLSTAIPTSSTDTSSNSQDTMTAGGLLQIFFTTRPALQSQQCRCRLPIMRRLSRKSQGGKDSKQRGNLPNPRVTAGGASMHVNLQSCSSHADSCAKRQHSGPPHGTSPSARNGLPLGARSRLPRSPRPVWPFEGPLLRTTRSGGTALSSPSDSRREMQYPTIV